MASIWRHPNSKYWSACYTDQDGQRVKKSTKKTHRAHALTVALEWERTADKAREGELTADQCQKVLNEILEKTTGETLKSTRTREFLNGWLSGKELSKSEGTHIRYSNTVKLFLKSLAKRAEQPLRAISPGDVERFRDGELRAGKARSTVNVDLKTLRNAFNRARNQGLIDTNPVESVELPIDSRHQRGAFTPEQIQALLGTAAGEWKTAVMFGYYVGARLGDAVSMTVENIDLPAKVVRYKQAKTKREIECPMHPELETHLLSLPGTDDQRSLLTPTLEPKPIGGRSGLSREFKDIMKKAGVDDGRIEKAEGNKRGRSFSTLSFHALRHSFVSHLANAGVADELRMKLSGHTNTNVHGKYTKLQMDPLRAAVEQLPKAKGSK